ncbi:MAG: c-type cytochrome domain-containing protein [Opitutaceae bacterium]
MFGFIRVFLLLLCSLSPLLAFTSHLSGIENLTTFFGRFHPVALHLPIGIILLVALMETLRLVSLGRLKFTTELPVFLGAFSAVAAMTLGVLLMQGEAMKGDLVISHLRWGIATAVAANVILILRFVPQFNQSKRVRGAYYGAIYVTCGILTWASHQGASITHGETYLTAYAPWIDQDVVSAEDVALLEGLSKSLEERDSYQHLIAPIFEQKCYECHRSSSFKGNLVMDTYAGLIQGGDVGPALVPSDLESSLMIQRIHLPLADEERMPPANKPQLTAEETTLIEWWITAGAPEQKAIAELKPSAEVLEQIEVVTASLFEQINAEPESHEHAYLSEEAVADLRAPLASLVADLRKQFPGMVDYVDNQSAEIAVRAFHHSWTDDDFAALKPIASNITELVLPRNSLTIASAAGLESFTELQTLDLRYADLGDEFISKLPVAKLVRLNLFDTQLTDEAVAHLSSFDSLERLTLGGNTLSDSAIEELRESLPNAVVTGNLDHAVIL